MPRTGQPSGRRVAAVERATALLDALEHGGELGTNELARRTGLNASTVSRVLATLAAGGLVEHLPASGRYRLGVRLVRLGEAVLARLDLRDLARPHLRALSELTGETATLSAPGDAEAAVTVDFVESPASVQSVARLGRPSVAHATATGKVMLAYGAAEAPRGRLEAYTERTITSAAALARELERVRGRGFADARGEREEGLHAIAAPVLDARGDLVAILGVQGPSWRFGDDAMAAAVPLLLERAAAISTGLGAVAPSPVRSS